MGLIVVSGKFGLDGLPEGVSLIKTDGCSLIGCAEAVVILGAGACAEIRAALGVIVNGDELSENLPRGVQLITCGVSPKNTVSITSRTPEKITLSLNRSIRTQSGVIEPLELPVPANDSLSEYELMASFAAELLLEARK